MTLDKQAHDKCRYSDSRAWPDPVGNLVTDINIVPIWLAEVEDEQPHGFLEKDFLRESWGARFFGIKKQRQMIAAISLPTIYIWLGNIPLPKNLSCHIIGRIDDKKEHKSDTIDTNLGLGGRKVYGA